MRTCARTAEPLPAGGLPAGGPGAEPVRARCRPGEAGFTLIEMLVAMMLLSLVGLTLARFQTFQLSGAAGLSTLAGARLEADNLAVDVLAAPGAPVAAVSGVGRNAGIEWHHEITPYPSPDPALMPDLVRVEIRVSLQPGGQPLAARTVLRGRGSPILAQ